jgi:hypothetical protein
MVGFDLTLRGLGDAGHGRASRGPCRKVDGSAPVSLKAPPRDEVGDGSGLAISASVTAKFGRWILVKMIHGVPASGVRVTADDVEGDPLFTGTPAGGRSAPATPGRTIEGRHDHHRFADSTAMMRGKVVLITASGRIGRETARLFADAGATVIAVVRARAAAAELRDEIGGGRVVPIAADVADGPAMEAMVQSVQRFPASTSWWRTPDWPGRSVRGNDRRCAAPCSVNVFGAADGAPLPEGNDRAQRRIRSSRPSSASAERRATPPIRPANSPRADGRIASRRAVGSFSVSSAYLPSSTSTEFDAQKMRHGRLWRNACKPIRRIGGEIIVKMAQSRRREIVIPPGADGRS